MDWGWRPSPAPARERPWGARASKPFLSLQTARAARGPQRPLRRPCARPVWQGQQPGLPTPLRPGLWKHEKNGDPERGLRDLG